MDSLERCVQHLKTLIAHRTVNPGGDEHGLCTHLSDELKKLGADSVEIVSVDRPESPGGYVYAQFGEPNLLLNVHIDTVPANSGWQHDPLVARVTDRRVYGLGSCDIKGAIAAILTALAETKAHNLGVLFSGDEENGSRCVPHFLATQDTSRIKRAIVCEPTAGAAGIRHRGMLAYKARYVGKGGHSSRADTMEKPIVELCKLGVELNRIAKEELSSGPEGMKGLCINVANLTGGVAFNVVPDLAELSFSLRPPPGFDQAAFTTKLEAARLASHPKIKITHITDHQPFECGDHQGIRELVGTHASDFVSLDFWTEAALMQAAGIDAVVIGPGDIAQAHCADEFVTLDDLHWAITMFEDVISRHASV